MSIEAVVREVERFRCGHVVVTGGEPLIVPALPELSAALRNVGFHLTLETSATLFRHVECDLVSISPKLSNSTPAGTRYADVHEKHRLNPVAIKKYISQYSYQLKFVVEKASDLTEIETLIKRLPHVDRECIMLMPQARTQERYVEVGRCVAELCLKRNYRFCPRLQVELWGGEKGK